MHTPRLVGECGENKCSPIHFVKNLLTPQNQKLQRVGVRMHCIFATAAFAQCFKQ